jgi:hypothetical protein
LRGCHFLHRTNKRDIIPPRCPWDHHSWDTSGFRSCQRGPYILPSCTREPVSDGGTHHGSRRRHSDGTRCRERVSEAQIVSSEQALFMVRSDLLERQRQLERSIASEVGLHPSFMTLIRTYQLRSRGASLSCRTDSFLASIHSLAMQVGRFLKVFCIVYLTRSMTELSSIRREIQGLEALEYQMRRNLEYMQQRRTTALYAGTLRGRVRSCIGGLFALYCAFRVGNVSTSPFVKHLRLILPSAPPRSQSSTSCTRYPPKLPFQLPICSQVFWRLSFHCFSPHPRWTLLPLVVSSVCSSLVRLS